MNVFFRVEKLVKLNDEVFDLSDVISVIPYDKAEWKVHFCNGRKHYVSDGVNTRSCDIPSLFHEEIFMRLPEIRMCRSQRLNDERYFENLRNARR
jgi:hypothetical protein